MPALLVAVCVLLSIPALAIGAMGDPPWLIAGAILLGSATIAAAVPDRETPRKGPESLD